MLFGKGWEIVVNVLAIYAGITLVSEVGMWLWQKLYPRVGLQPLVSLVLLVRNHAEYIEGFVTSVIAPWYDQRQHVIADVVLVDLSSNDQTGEILERLARRFKFLIVVKYEGEAIAGLRYAQALCRGKIVCRMELHDRIPLTLVRGHRGNQMV